MSSSRVLCCLPSVKKQKQDFHFNFRYCIIKQLLDSVFVVYRIIKVEGQGSSAEAEGTANFFLILSNFDKQDKM